MVMQKERVRDVMVLKTAATIYYSALQHRQAY